ncbi:MAG: hypothetical protein E7310_02895 [Clostridiales bacterium]|nr:hypothetical protein [Clostridiales bacterium]
MKKLLVSLAALIIFMTCFTACSSQANQESSYFESIIVVETTEYNDIVAETTIVEEETVATIMQNISEVPESNESSVIARLDFEPYKSQLAENEQKVYDEFLIKIRNYEEFVVDFSDLNCNIDYDGFHRVTDALRGDYNELRLYLKTSELYSDEIYNGNVRYISVRYEYNWLRRDEFDPEFMEAHLEEINRVCDEIIARMPDGTYAEKYEFLGREIYNMTVYGENDINNVPDEEVDGSYAYMNGPILYGKAICQGYAYAYQYLCNRAGLWCITTSGGCHCWNLVMLEDGSTYNVDLTWADTENDFERYFLLTQEEIEVDHTLYEGEWKATGK